MDKTRLQKIIANAAICSRRKAEDFILQQRVTVNGELAIIGQLADPLNDVILVDGKPIPKKRDSKVLLLNKPLGFISSCKNHKGKKCVLTLLPKQLRNGLYPVGRLDFHSRGALLITNMGELTLKLTHPRFQHVKVYRVLLTGKITDNNLYLWRQGVELEGRFTMPAKIKLIESINDTSLLEISLCEGRNRQIRRVAHLLGHEVIDLLRIDVSGIQLGDLREGSWRELNKSELKHLSDLIS